MIIRGKYRNLQSKRPKKVSKTVFSSKRNNVLTHTYILLNNHHKTTFNYEDI